MKNTKYRQPAAALAIAIALLVCASCRTPANSTNPFIGRWSGEVTNTGGELELGFNADGSCFAIEAGKAANGTWVQRGTSVTVRLEGSEEDLHGGLVSRDEIIVTNESSDVVATLRRAR